MRNYFNACILLAIFVTLVPYESFCCEQPPEEQRVSYQELVRRTEHIMIASPSLVDGPPFQRTYTFKVEQQLKGQMKASFIIEGRSQEYSGMDTDCKIYPGFELGKQYLIFFDKPYHNSSFLEIRSDNDPWLVKVINEISSQAGDSQLIKRIDKSPAH